VFFDYNQPANFLLKILLSSDKSEKSGFKQEKCIFIFLNASFLSNKKK